MANPYASKKAAKKPMKKAAKKAMPKGKAAPTSFDAFRAKLMAKKGKPAMKSDKEVTPRAEAMARVRALSKR